jgi:hypothetical protein
MQYVRDANVSRSFFIRIGLVVAATIAAAGPVHAQRASACGGANEWHRSFLRQRLEALMVSDDSSTTAMRRLYRLPRVSPDSIVFVTDERTCERAAREYYRYHLGPRPLGGVDVARIGNMYAVYGAIRAGEWTILEIFTRDFELVASLAS